MSENSSLLRNTQEAPVANARPWWFKYALAGGAVVVIGGVVWIATAQGEPVVALGPHGQVGPTVNVTTTGVPVTTTTTSAPETTTVATTTTSVPVTTTVAPVTTTVPATNATFVRNATNTTVVRNSTKDTIVAQYPAQFAAFFKEFEAKLDRSVDPCDDFYQYACGGWLNATTLKPSDTTVDSSFYVVAQDNDRILKDILATKPAVIDPFYQACLTEGDVNADAVVDVSVRLNHIATIQSLDELLAFAGILNTESSVSSFLDVGVTTDPKNATLNVVEIAQGGLTLPSVEYYEADMLAPYVASLQTYLETLATVDAFTGVTAKAVLDLEAQLAKISLTQAELRNPWATYHKFALGDVTAKYPQIASFLSGAQPALLNQTNVPVLVPTPTYFDSLAALLQATDLGLLKVYLSFRLIYTVSPYLGETFRQANHDFNGALQGQVSTQTRAEYCWGLTQSLLGEYLGKLFMDKVFDGATKAQAQDLIRQIEASMVDVLNDAAWLDGPTRQVGLDKVAQIRNFIGGPDAVTPLPFNLTNNFYTNVQLFGDWATSESWASLYEPVDPTVWDMFAFTVNAYNDGTANKIVFPAAILQPPFYNARSYPAVANYARIGMVMGHELTHGFDDEGRNFDPHGQLNAWWSDAVSATFDKNAKCLADQYSTFPIVSVDGHTVLGHLNGQLTLGENIADNGGLKLAYLAYQRAKKANKAIAQDLGTDDAKLYFTAFAQGWCQKRSDGNAILRKNTDPHSPGKWRVHGPLYNSQTFADTFQCPIGSPMNPSKKCVIW
ncbi:hypothetical protein DYB25_001563 [Aphanomyces astaci]|uniref:Peptidase M13 C-terminal domain-containing protein n=1 Tax=Aphanomyces astaci TaxID=112090 RepID=A0A397B923_APHAT|nr:hypothetical protein DYB25_001563 [Aphanomyces astaci]RHY56954.1 hypothetical protein DYB38_008481 [Aphanomyces astaci]RHY58532.1 hypothetical protein DYB30_005688 [Aphanomyces astaci]RHZ05836.1 hypothetical protein DYB26_002591 [Aphanomyces astaci]RHZ33923.1 hypothetical protein DYB31_003647 [Aphanomyces astaci]